MSFDTLAYTGYKSLLKDRAKWLKKKKPSLTLKKIAQHVPMQYTYLSKTLNDENAHLSEDHLYRVCRELEFNDSETDFALLLRSHATAQQPDRREHLSKKIDGIRKKTRVTSAEHSEFDASLMEREMQFLLDPLGIIVYVSLFIAKIKKDPRVLCSRLGISNERLKLILEMLERHELISCGETPFEIKKVHGRKKHFGKDHPLMRTHQGLVKSALQARVQQTPEEDKESFMVTFTFDEKGFEKTKEAFQKFLKEVQDQFETSKNTHLYQMSFDLVKWY